MADIQSQEQGPISAHIVDNSLKSSLASMKKALLSIEAARDGSQVMSTPVMNHVFYVADGELVCVPARHACHGIVDATAAMQACSPLKLDLNNSTKITLVDAIDEWVSRPVFNESRQVLAAV